MAFHRFIEAALADEPLPVFGSGDQVRDFTYVDDVVEATLRAGERALPAGTIMNVCGGVPTTVRDVVALLGDLLGRPLRVDHRSPATGDVFRTGGSAERARALLDWRPDTRLDDGLARQLEWHLARGSGRASQGKPHVALSEHHQSPNHHTPFVRLKCRGHSVPRRSAAPAGRPVSHRRGAPDHELHLRVQCRKQVLDGPGCTRGLHEEDRRVLLRRS